MKQVININFQGRIVPIEITAYEILKAYIATLTLHFDGEQGCDEIINDIENRIGELFQERIKAGATCIIDDDVNAIIKSIGRPEDFDEVTPTANAESTQQASNEPYTNTAGKKRLFRDENHSIVGGVCSGVANYFDVDVSIVRVVFLILLFSFGIGFIPYIILWIVVPSSATAVIGSRKKKLYRDGDDKYVGGVAQGIAHYFGINVWIPRLIFLLPLLAYVFKNRWGNFLDFDTFDINLSPGPILVYIILWMVLPEAKTTAEKLAMKGEKVDINSIKTSVVEEMKGMQMRVQKMGKEATTEANNRAKVFGNDIHTLAKRKSTVFADIITFIVKALVYSVLAIVGISLVVALFAVVIVALSSFSYKNFILNSGLQTLLAWGTLIFFIIAPLIGIITWLIRKITKVKKGGKLLALSFSAMWVVGWVCVIFLLASVAKEFAYNADVKPQTITLQAPNVNALEVINGRPSKRISQYAWNRNSMVEMLADDSKALIKNVRINISRAYTDSFKIEVQKEASGSTEANADYLATQIQYNIAQQDSTVTIDRGIEINTKDKFRNQRVIVTIYVPIGKRIKVQNSIGELSQIYFNGWGFQRRGYDNTLPENVETNWQNGVWYTMGIDGLQNVDGNKPSIKRNSDEPEITNQNGADNENGTYRYDDNTNKPKVDSALNEIKQKQSIIKDSLEAEKKKIERQLEKYNVTTSSILQFMPSHLLIWLFN